MRPVRRELMMIFQDPYASLNPRKRVGFIVAEALQVHKIGTRRGDQAPRAGAARGRRAEPGALQPLPARVLRRAAAADRRRAGARRQPEADRLRRAGLGARRLRAGADPQPAQGPAERVRADLRLHRARPQCRSPHLRSGDGDVPRQDRRDRRPATSSTRRRSIPYTGALLSAVPIPNPELGRQRQPIVLEGDVPSPINPPNACRFHPRCPRFHEGHCDVEEPQLYSFGEGHGAACHYPLERWPMKADEMRLAEREPAHDLELARAARPCRALRPGGSSICSRSPCSAPCALRSWRLALGASANRSISLGLYLVGCVPARERVLPRQPRARSGS